MTTETNGDKQTEPRLLSEEEAEAVVGGTIGASLYAMSLLARDHICRNQMLPRSNYPGC
jgi:hypothetical protein